MLARIFNAPLQLALGLLGLLAVWAVAGALPRLSLPAAGMGTVLLMAAFAPDVIDLIVRLYCRYQAVPTEGLGLGPAPSTALAVGDFTAQRKRLHVRPYAFVASVFNLGDEVFRFAETMAPFSGRVWVIDDGSTDDTVSRLRSLGITCLTGRVNRRKPSALRELLWYLPEELRTVIVLDPDTHFAGGPAELEPLLFDFQRSGMSAVTPSFEVRPDGLIGDLQGLEYYTALSLGRKSLDDFAVSSGVALYDRQALERSLGEHSLSVYAEDLEHSLILLGAGERIYYDDRLVFETEGKRNWRGLFSQRVGWSYGLLRVFSLRFGDVRRVARRRLLATYQFMGYLGVMGIALHPIRMLALGILAASFANGVAMMVGGQRLLAATWADPQLFVATYFTLSIVPLLALIFAVPKRRRLAFLPVLPLYFFYALFLIVPTTIGYANWISLRFFGRRVYRDHYQGDLSLAAEATRRAGASRG